jgi:hypothetical protein
VPATPLASLVPAEYDVKIWDSGKFNAKNLKKEEINAYTKWRTAIYTKEKWRDNDLWLDFWEDFRTFTRKEFADCTKTTLKKLRDHLRANGVYVKKTRSVPIATGLADMLQEEV